MLTRAIAVFIVFMLIVYAFGLLININTQNLMRRQTIDYTQMQLVYLAEILNREMEHVFLQLGALSNDFGLRLLMLQDDLSDMDTIYTNLRRINTHVSALFMSTPHTSDAGIYLPNINRISRWGELFAAPSYADMQMILVMYDVTEYIFPYQQDLIMVIPISGNLISGAGEQRGLCFVRISGNAIRRTMTQMADAYGLSITLYSQDQFVLSVGSEIDYDRAIEISAPFPGFDFKLVAQMPNTILDNNTLPTTVATVLFYALSFIIGVVCFALYVHRLVKQIHAEKQGAEQAKMGQLSLQITPHFLYNSFYQIYRLGKLGDVETISELSLKLSQYYQYITRSRGETATLKLEVKHAVDYASIQNIRFAGKVECVFDKIPEECEDINVPNLFLQPLIENAYQHGLENNNGLYLIRVGFRFDNDTLCISVDDNGTPISDLDLLKLKELILNPESAPVISSLVNISQRFTLMYGDNACVDVSHSEIGGFSVMININVKELN